MPPPTPTPVSYALKKETSRGSPKRRDLRGEPTKGREIHAQVLMSHLGTMHMLMSHSGRVHVLMSHSGMVHLLLVDTGKSQSLQLILQGDCVFSLQTFCCGSFYGQSPASKGGGASSLGTLSLTHSPNATNLDTSSSSQPEPTERACPPLSCPSSLNPSKCANAFVVVC